LAFLYGISAISFSLAQLVSRGFEVFERYIQMGELDRVLTRPVSPFLQILSIELALSRLGRLGQGLVVLSIGLSGLTVHWDTGKVILLLMTVIAGMLVFLSLFVMGAVTTIWTVSTTEFTNIFTHGGTYLTRFPMTIYQEWFRNLFTFIVPLGFVSFLPATIILEKPLWEAAPSADWSTKPLWEAAPSADWIGWLPLPTAIAFFGLALLTWRWGLKKYQSTGN
jgi:ABC-2 type transport system permease protein